MSWADLHIHSNYSDGSQTVKDIFFKAKLMNIDVISITDHDTVDNMENAYYWSNYYNVDYIPGIEISAYDYSEKRKIHILGYNYSKEAKNIKALCNPLLAQRGEHTIGCINILKNDGYDINESAVRELFPNSKILYKQHIMLYLMKIGLTDSIYSDLYQILFKGNGICSKDIEYIDCVDAVEAIIKDGGHPVLAHPGLQDSFYLIPELKKKGLWGVELHHESNNHKHRMELKVLAKEYDLVLTGGSDSHGTYGSIHGIGDIVAPHSFFVPEEKNNPHRLNFAKELMVKCGEILYSVKVSVDEKSEKNSNHADLVTIYDINTEHRLVKSLKKEFPNDNFVTEENVTPYIHTNGYTWIIDPIDGTTNFIHQSENFSISVGCYYNGQPYFGLVYDVMHKHMFQGIPGKGAKIESRKISTLNQDISLKHSLGDFSLNSISILKSDYSLHLNELNHRIRGHRSLGCASLIICNIALGKLDFYISAKLKIWDYSAAVIILKEVGGEYFVKKDFKEEKDCRGKRIFLACGSRTISNELGTFFKKGNLSLENEKCILG